MSFPTHQPLEDALVHAPRSFCNVNQMLFWMRDELIRDTPFRYADVYNLVEKLEDLDPVRFKYHHRTVCTMLSWFKNVGLLHVLDDYERDPAQHLYMWSSYYKRRLRVVHRLDGPSSTITEQLEKLLRGLNSDSALQDKK